MTIAHNCTACDRPCSCPDFTPLDGCMSCGRPDCPLTLDGPDLTRLADTARAAARLGHGMSRLTPDHSRGRH
jgi:hypothetical protein